ncbi:hypothetical protein Drorol1_Dr00023965, partial [Drosera rotundifolia]
MAVGLKWNQGLRLVLATVNPLTAEINSSRQKHCLHSQPKLLNPPRSNRRRRRPRDPIDAVADLDAAPPSSPFPPPSQPLTSPGLLLPRRKTSSM